MSDCIFCKIVAGDIPALKVYEDDAHVAFLDIQPVNVGHTLVVPKRHASDVLGMEHDAVCALFGAVRRVSAAAVKAVGADGFNIGVNTGAAAGQVVMHPHVHVIPRFDGDGLRHWPKRDISKEQMEDAAKKIAEAVVVGSGRALRDTA